LLFLSIFAAVLAQLFAFNNLTTAVGPLKIIIATHAFVLWALRYFSKRQFIIIFHLLAWWDQRCPIT